MAEVLKFKTEEERVLESIDEAPKDKIDAGIERLAKRAEAEDKAEEAAEVAAVQRFLENPGAVELASTVGQAAYVEGLASAMESEPPRDAREAAAFALAQMALQHFRGCHAIAMHPSNRTDRASKARKFMKEFTLDLQRQHVQAVAFKVTMETITTRPNLLARKWAQLKLWIAKKRGKLATGPTTRLEQTIEKVRESYNRFGRKRKR